MAIYNVKDSIGNLVIDSLGNYVIIGIECDEFTEVPDAVLTHSVNYNTIKTNTDFGKERLRNKWVTPRNKFTLQFYMATEDIMISIRDFFINKGNFDTFIWTNPVDELSYMVRFVSDKININYAGYDYYNIQFDFIEVL